MTTFERSRNRDIQDGCERGCYGKLEYVKGAGAIVRVDGTDTQDEEAAVLNIGGVSFNLPEGTDTEVILLSGGSDTNLKFAVMTIPRDKQREWKEGTGGVQHPTDGSFALEFNGKRAHLTQAKFAIGGGGELEVVGGTVYIRGNLVVDGITTVNQRVVTPVVVPGTENVPGFEA